MTSLPSTAPSLLLEAGVCSVSMLGPPTAAWPHQHHVSLYSVSNVYHGSVSQHHCISTTKLYPMAIFTGPDVAAATPSLSAVEVVRW